MTFISAYLHISKCYHNNQVHCEMKILEFFYVLCSVRMQLSYLFASLLSNEIKKNLFSIMQPILEFILRLFDF